MRGDTHMNVALFTSQINQLLQSEKEDYLKAVCELLKMHMQANVSLKNAEEQAITEALLHSRPPQKYKLVLPIVVGNVRLGSLALCRPSGGFNEDEVLCANITLSVCTILLRQKKSEWIASKKRRLDSVRTVINTLSFSELEATTHILKGADSNEIMLVAGHIAKKLKIASSVITGALRKLEGADLIETRSLGMKGTYIRIKDALLTEELAKL